MHCVRPWHFLKDLLILILGLTQLWKNRVLIFQIDILFVCYSGGHKGMWDAMFAIKGTQR